MNPQTVADVLAAVTLGVLACVVVLHWVVSCNVVA